MADDPWDHLWETLETLPGDWHLKLNLAAECMWSAELRWTEHPNASDEPDLSIVAFAVAGSTPYEVASKVTETIRRKAHPNDDSQRNC